MERENVYFEDVPEKNYKAPNAWGVCFVDSADNDYTFYPAIIFGDDLQSINESDIRYVFTPDTAFRIGRRLIEYSLRCMYYKKRKRAPKTFNQLKEKAMKNAVYIVTSTDTMDYEHGNFGETVKVFLKRSDALKWIKEQRAEQKEWPKPMRDVFTYKKFEVV